jgi:phosphatidylglycerophosphate synthase
VTSVYDLKPAFQRLLTPPLRGLHAIGVTPNGLTIAAIFGSIAIAWLVGRSSSPRVLLLLPAWLFVRMALNALDGMMARTYDMSTPVGAILNEVGDVLSDVALYACLAFVDVRATWVAFGFVLVAALTEFCGVLSQALGAGRRYDGPMGKSDRALLVGAWGLLAAFLPVVRDALPWVLGAGVLLGVLTCVRRSTPAARLSR